MDVSNTKKTKKEQLDSDSDASTDALAWTDISTSATETMAAATTVNNNNGAMDNDNSIDNTTSASTDETTDAYTESATEVTSDATTIGSSNATTNATSVEATDATSDVSTNTYSNGSTNDSSGTDTYTDAFTATFTENTTDTDTDSATNDEDLQKIVELHYELQYNMEACYAKWYIYIASVESVYLHSQSQPHVEDLQKVTRIIQNTPKLSVIREKTLFNNTTPMDMEMLNILHKVILIENVQLEARPVADFRKMLAGNVYESMEEPTSFFEIISDDNSNFIQFANKLQVAPRKAFLTRPLDIFYGLRQMELVRDCYFRYNEHTTRRGRRQALPNRVKGILTRTTFTPNMMQEILASWNTKCYGANVRCVGICEYLPEPIEPLDLYDSGTNTTYLLIKKSKQIILRYLAFYGDSLTTGDKETFLTWLAKHQHSGLFITYTALLAMILIAKADKRYLSLPAFLGSKGEVITGFCVKVFQCINVAFFNGHFNSTCN